LVAERFRHAGHQLLLAIFARRAGDHPLILGELLHEQERIVPDELRFGGGLAGRHGLGGRCGHIQAPNWVWGIITSCGSSAIRFAPARAAVAQSGRSRCGGGEGRQSGMTAVASISTLARSSTSAFTSTSAIAG